MINKTDIVPLHSESGKDVPLIPMDDREPSATPNPVELSPPKRGATPYPGAERDTTAPLDSDLYLDGGCTSRGRYRTTEKGSY